MSPLSETVLLKSPSFPERISTLANWPMYPLAKKFAIRPWSPVEISYLFWVAGGMLKVIPRAAGVEAFLFKPGAKGDGVVRKMLPSQLAPR